MPNLHGSESTFELATIERLEGLGYTHRHGSLVDRDPRDVVLYDSLRSSLATRYPELGAAELTAAVDRVTRPEGTDSLTRNRAFHVDTVIRGFELPLDRPMFVREAPGPVYNAGPVTAPAADANVAHIHPIDWDRPERNIFEVVNQLPISGLNDRRPDIIVFVNGLPLVLFELKNPYDQDCTLDGALNQIRHYTVHVPRLFEFNAFCVGSDGADTRHGMWTAGDEHYAPWKSVDGVTVEPGRTGSMKALIEGLFPKDRLLAYIRDFIGFEVDKSGIVKKGAKYHQFFAVRAAVLRTLAAFAPGADGRIGVVWHTTGSGKSLSMAFLVGILRREKALANPSFVIQVDRTDLDDQLHDQFVLLRHLVGDVAHAESVEELRTLLRSEGGEVVFTTIEKFALKKGPDGKPIEATHPTLSTRGNIIIIADEAHRSQYGFLEGFARYLRDALPNAKRLGFTGTPVSLHGAGTIAVFGDYIHTYDIRQSQEDGATVSIFYAPRQAKLHLNGKDVDAALREIGTKHGTSDAVINEKKSKWAALAAAVGAKERLDEIAADLLKHFQERTATLVGKAMVVCMTRANCVRMYDALSALPGCPPLAIVMTGSLAEDPKSWSERGFITTKPQRDKIKKQMVDPADPLAIVIVCDMWLTGTDIPCLHTLYIDKPMRGHNMIQAISRVNRVFRNKPSGLIVDYIGVGDELRDATNKYGGGGGTGDPAPGVEEAARPLFFECLDAIRALLPSGQDWGAWRGLTPLANDDLHLAAFTAITETDEHRDAFLQAELRLSNVFGLVKHLDDCGAYADEVIFYQRARNQVLKTIPGRKPKKSVDEAVRDLVDDAINSDAVVDIYKLAGIAIPDVSILDDAFLQTFKDRPNEDLRLKLLRKLLEDELQRRSKKNIAQIKTFQELLQATLDRYHKRIIDAAAVIKAMVEIRKDLDAAKDRAARLGLGDDEYAFYATVERHCGEVYDEPFLRDLIHEVVLTIKGNLKVDWTEPHREDVKAAVRAAVKRVLRRRKVREEDFEAVTERLMEQAAALYANWPVAA